MIEPRSDNNSYFRCTIFLVLFFLFISAFTKNSECACGKTNQHELSTEIQSDLVAIIVSQQFFTQKNIRLFIINTGLTLFFSGQTRIAENNLINQKIKLFQKTGLIIRPVLHFLFYCQYHYVDTQDLPDLS
jgi:hypothetical protein